MEAQDLRALSGAQVAAMSATLRRTMSKPDFLAWEDRRDGKFEFDGFGPIAMTGGTAEHSRIKVNLVSALRARLCGGPCQVYDSDTRVAAADALRYPDASVSCVPLPRGATELAEPRVVFEVLSPSTSFTDRIAKNREYRATPSIAHYVILEQTRPAATIHTRRGEAWETEIVSDAAVLRLPTLRIEIPLSEIYEDIAFDDDIPAEA